MATATVSEYDENEKPDTEVVRQYDPRLYGFPPGTLWPLTAEAAQRGEHRRVSERRVWWYSNVSMTVRVVESDGKVVDAAPVVRKFIGQPLSALRGWMEKKGGFMSELLSKYDYMDASLADLTL